MELEDTIYSKITELSGQGDALANKKEYREALSKYHEALEMIPEPKRDWEASTWIYAAIGDAFFFSGNYRESMAAFLDAFNSPGGLNNPFINLRIGECYFELEDLANAEEFMLRAYMWEGKDIFKGEKKKYRNFMSKKYDI